MYIICVCFFLFHVLSQGDQKPAHEQILRYVMGVHFRKFLSEWDALFLKRIIPTKIKYNFNTHIATMFRT